MECTKGKLGTGLTDSLSGDDADRFAFLNHFAGSKVAAVAFGADAVFCLTGENGADFHFLQRGFFDDFADIFGQLLASTDDEFASVGVVDVMDGGTSEQFFTKGDDNVFTFLEGCGGQSAEGTAVFGGNDDIVGHVDETTGEVTSVSSFKSGIGKTFTSTVGRDEVLKHGEAFFKVGDNGVLDDFVAGSTSFLRFCHQSAHTGELTNLFFTTTGTGIVHHVDGVEALVVGFELFHEGFGEAVVGSGPDVDDVVVSLVVGDKTH